MPSALLATCPSPGHSLIAFSDLHSSPPFAFSCPIPYQKISRQPFALSLSFPSNLPHDSPWSLNVCRPFHSVRCRPTKAKLGRPLFPHFLEDLGLSISPVSKIFCKHKQLEFGRNLFTTLVKEKDGPSRPSCLHSSIQSEEEKEPSLVENEAKHFPASPDDQDTVSESFAPNESLPPPGTTSSPSSLVNALIHLRRFERRVALEGGAGEVLVRALCAQDLEGTVDLLTDSFAQLFGFTFRPLLRLQVQLYLQQRLLLLPYAVTLIALFQAPAAAQVSAGSDDDKSTDGSDCSHVPHAGVVATVELSFSETAKPSFPSLNPPKGTAYLCNMAVLQPFRRQGVGRTLLQVAEDLTSEMGHEELYLHCRLSDEVPQKLYRRAGFEVVATDNIFSPILYFQRRRHLMRKILWQRPSSLV